MAEGGTPQRSFKDTFGKGSDDAEGDTPRRLFKDTYGKGSGDAEGRTPQRSFRDMFRKGSGDAKSGTPQRSFKDTFGKGSSDAEGDTSQRSLKDTYGKGSGDAEGRTPQRSFRDMFRKGSGDAKSGTPQRSFKDTYGKGSGDAEGRSPQRSFKDTYGKGSGDAEEIFCEPCSNMKKFVAVIGYCPICNEYMCGHCVNYHRNQRMTRSHPILQKDQIPAKPSHGTSPSPSLCSVVCPTHHPEIIRYFCTDHGTPCCVDCMTINHPTCKRDRVQDISIGFQATKEFKEIHHNLDKLHKELKTMENSLNLGFNDLQYSYNYIQQTITEFRTQVNDYLDKVQKQLTDEAAEMKQKHETVMNNLIAENKALNTELEDRIKTLKNDSDMNSIFVHTKQAKQRLDSMVEELNTLKETERQQKHQIFRPSTEIQRILSEETPLGKLSPTPNIHTTVVYRGKVKVKPRFSNDCWITGCTLLNPRHMVVTDVNNSKVKVIDLEADKILTSYSPSSTPWGITRVNAESVAVISHEGKIELLHVTSNSIQHQEYINCSMKECWHIAFHDNKFAVSNNQRVKILDIHGNVLHTIQPKQGTQHVLQKADNIIFGHDPDTVIVSDFETDTVRVVTFTGQVLHTYTHDTLRYLKGITLTSDGVLYVCSRLGGCIHVVSPDFKRSKIIINNDKRVAGPRCITYCDTKQRLYISNNNTSTDLENLLQVYDLNI